MEAITGIVKSNGTTISAATAGTDYLTPTGSAELLTDFPILNQNTTGNAATVTTNANLTGDITSTGNTTIIANKQTMTATAPVSITGTPTVIASGAVDISIAEATPGTAGSMSASDKTKLDGIATPVHTIGESYGGGIVFYVYDNGQHGLIAATADQSTSMRWYAGTITNTMAYADGLSAGKANTSIIIANQGYGDGATYAARICNEYSVTVGDVTYGDWYLPSKYELHLLYLQKNVVGGFANNYYWSSTESSSSYAWAENFGGGQVVPGKEYTWCVRAIRVF